ncbi:MAG: FAD-dependent monooxygenase [Alphaproteobacteria bacterium]|nr:FAD-dependent monooxygenase [Alphaproteobacteria bacterium]
MADRSDVLIIGAGPAGGALGYLLASRGFTVTVVERHLDFAREFRGEGLQPSGLTCIEQMGLAEPFAAVPQRTVARMCFFDGRRVVEIPIPGGGATTRMVSQPGMLEMFATESARYDGFTLLRGCTFMGLEREGGRVVGARVRDADGARVLRARLVVGADGRGSRTRRESGLAGVSLSQVFDVLWLKADLKGFLPDARSVWWQMAGAHAVLCYPSPDGLEQIGVVLAKGEVRSLPAAQRLDWILDRLDSPLGEALRAARDSVVGPAMLKVICERLETWSAPGLLLLGDAAHPMSPVGGQGINMALRDAIVAANHLCPALAGEGDLDAACAAIAAERLTEIREIQALQTREGQRLLNPSPFLIKLVPLLLKIPGLDITRMNRRRARMRSGLAEVALRV